MRGSTGRLAAALCAWLLSFAVGAADKDDIVPVTWSAQGAPSEAAAGATFRLQLRAAIRPGWHLYALSEPPVGPMATEIGLAEGDVADLASVGEDPPIERPDPVFGHPLRFHEKQAQFALALTTPADAPAGPARIHLMARYQACSEDLCLPPRTDSVEVSLNVLGRGAVPARH